jgi:hypothetical protein
LFVVDERKVFAKNGKVVSSLFLDNNLAIFNRHRCKIEVSDYFKFSLSLGGVARSLDDRNNLFDGRIGCCHGITANKRHVRWQGMMGVLGCVITWFQWWKEDGERGKSNRISQKSMFVVQTPFFLQITASSI